MSVVANELDYQQKILTHPVYNYYKQTPIQGTQNLSISAGGNEIIYECPPNQCWNPSKSFFSFTLTPGASTANRNWLWADTLACIQSIVVQTKGGLQLMNLTNYDMYHKSVLKAITKIEDYLENDVGAFTAQDGVCYGLNRSNNLVDGSADAVKCSGVRYPIAGPATLNAKVNYNEFAYVIGGGAAISATPVVNFRLPFSLLKETFLGLNKDIMFPEAIQIKIVFNPVSKIGFEGTSATIASTGAQAMTATSYTISNHLVYLAMEQDKEINNLVMQKVNSAEGLKVLIPYIYPVKVNLATGSNSWSLKFNRNNGSNLLRIYHTATVSAEVFPNTYNTSNIGASLTTTAKLNNIYYSLNNNRIQQFNVNCTPGTLEDYMSLQDLLRGSTLQSSSVYSYNWLWCQCFGKQTNALEYSIDDQNNIQGLPLDVEQKVDFFGDNVEATGLNHYTFSLCLKNLVVNNSGIQLI